MDSEFTRLSGLLEADAAKREAISKEVKEINRIFRSIQFTLHAVHNVCADESGVLSVCEQARQQFQELQPIWTRIFQSIGDESVEKYRAHWRFATEQLVFLAAFAYYLETHQLITIDQTIHLIGVGSNPIYAVPSIAPATTTVIAAASSSSSIAAGAASPAVSSPSPVSPAAASGVGLDLDDYLQGLTALPKELCRLCVNCVRTGNYKLPQQISTFVSDLYSGFRLLNLRNDALRRKFDAIKYDVAKIEEILYDCTVRGLGSTANASGSTNAAINAASKPLGLSSSSDPSSTDVTMN